jgi:hypothetical protein
MTAVAGAVFQAAQFNTYVRDNLSETAPAKATTPGGYFVTTGTNQIAERVPAEDFLTTPETTTSTTYVDLATVGPSVSAVTGAYALVIIGGQVGATTAAAASARMSFDVTGATTLAASDSRAFGKVGGTTDLYVIGSGLYLLTTLNPGTNVFTAKYRVSSGTGTFDDRRIAVFPY